ncbi:MAG: glycosyltransferase [Flavobacteriales bacterium]
MTNPKVIVTVTNDLTHDQRVRKVCDSLMKLGYTPHLVGRKLFTSEPIERPYPIKRFRLIFKKGAVFYAEYNIRLFLFLLFKKYNRIHANDLDTLLAAYLGSRFRKKPLVYDSHEYFTEVPELQDNPSAKRIWERIEEWIFPKLNEVITVNKSIATLYEKKYGGKVSVMRNIPEVKSKASKSKPLKSRKELGLPEDKIILIVQGTGINMDRGNEELAEAMKHLDGFLLLIIGSGDVLPMLKEKVEKDGLENRVMFKDKMPYEELKQFTAVSDAGMSVDKDTNINYRFSLPNKLFDFIHAGIPSIVSDLPEVKRIVSNYEVGTVLSSHAPEVMAREIKAYMNPLIQSRKEGSELFSALQLNLKEASKECMWQNEAIVLEKIYSKSL